MLLGSTNPFDIAKDRLATPMVSVQWFSFLVMSLLRQVVVSMAGARQPCHAY